MKVETIPSYFDICYFIKVTKVIEKPQVMLLQVSFALCAQEAEC